VRDIRDVLKDKEAEMERITREIEALRLAERLLSEETGEKRVSAILEDSSRDRMTPKVKVFP